MRQPFSKGFFVGGAIASAMTVTKGLLPGRQVEVRARRRDRDVRSARPSTHYPKPDNELTFNKLDSVFLSGNATRDDAPNHVKIQTHVPRELAQTWVSCARRRSTRSPTTSSRTAPPRSTST